MSLWNRNEGQVLEQEPWLEREVTNRRENIRQRHQEFIYTKQLSGVSAEEMPAHIAEAMTKGQLPTVLEHDVTIKKAHRTLLFVDILPGGAIPNKAIKLKPGYDNSLDTSIVLLDGPILNALGIPGVFPSHTGQYEITYATIPISTPETVNKDTCWLIDNMDAHIPDEYPLY